jgi:hypothetical protein
MLNMLCLVGILLLPPIGYCGFLFYGSVSKQFNNEWYILSDNDPAGSKHIADTE